MKRIKSFKLFESNIETIKMECEDILVELRDLGLSIDVKSMHLSHWTIEITIKDDLSKISDQYKTNVQTPIFEHLFSYLEEEGFRKIYDVVDRISYTTFHGDRVNAVFHDLKLGYDRVHKLKFEAR